MSKGLTYSQHRGSALSQDIVKSTIRLNDLTAVITDGAPGYGAAVIGGLPQGNILLLGAVLNAEITLGDADIIDAFNGDFSVGSAPTADGSLAGGEVDIIPSTAMVLGVAGLSTGNIGKSTTTEQGAILDNTAGTLELNLNVLIDDASISDDSSVIFNGVLHIAYIVLGDD